MNKKGFTLIELLAVVAILAIILIVSIPSVMSTIDKNKIKQYQAKEKIIIAASQVYFEEYHDTGKLLKRDDKYTVYIKDLLDERLLDYDNLDNPKTGQKFTDYDCVEIFNNASGVLTYNFMPNCTYIPPEIPDTPEPIAKATYGTSIVTTSCGYSNLYLSTDSKNPYTPQSLTLDEVHTETNYAYIRNLFRSITSNNKLISSIDNTTSGKKYVVSGTNTITFTNQVDFDSWISMSIWAGGLTTDVYVGQFKLIFDAGSVSTLAQAVTDKYIEPLVLVGSTSLSQYSWIDFLNIIDGGNAKTSNYPEGIIILKNRNISKIKQVSFYSNKAFNTTYDGFTAYQSSTDFDISITPW